MTGGRQQNKMPIHDIYVLDLATGTWRAPTMEGAPPQCPGAAAILSGDYLLFVGGTARQGNAMASIHALNLGSLAWSEQQVATAGRMPAQRQDALVCLIAGRPLLPLVPIHQSVVWSEPKCFRRLIKGWSGASVETAEPQLNSDGSDSKVPK